MPSRTAASNGLRTGRLAARIPKQSSSMYQIWKPFSKAASSVDLAVTCKWALIMPAYKRRSPERGDGDEGDFDALVDF